MRRSILRRASPAAEEPETDFRDCIFQVEVIDYPGADGMDFNLKILPLPGESSGTAK